MAPVPTDEIDPLAGLVGLCGWASAHDSVLANLREALLPTLAAGPFRSAPAGTRVLAGGRFLRPDLVVASPPFDRGRDVLSDPVLVAEVLSAESEARDRGERLRAYEGIASLRACLLLDARVAVLDLYLRDAEGWRHVSHAGTAAEAALPIVDRPLRLAALYRGVEVGD